MPARRCQRREAYTRSVKRRAAFVVLIAAIAGPGVAAAEGERTPMFGGALTYTDAADRKAELVGGELEIVWWLGRLGLAAEAAAGRGVADEHLRNLAVGGSARVLIADWLWPSLFERRDVELGVELQLIAERAWWQRDDSADAFGLGVAFRMRGGSDWEFSDLLAESRLFVRVMKPRDEVSDVLARTSDAMSRSPDRGLTVIIGLGAAFGIGTQRYLERFRLKSLDWPR